MKTMTRMTQTMSMMMVNWGYDHPVSVSVSLFVLVLGSCILRDLGKPRMDQQNKKPKLFCSELFVFVF